MEPFSPSVRLEPGKANSRARQEQAEEQEITSKRSILGLGLILSALILSGCGPAKEVKLDAAANGRQVELQKGQTLVITLESNPSTGYRWEVVESDESILRQMGEPEFKVSDPREPPPPGAGGLEIWRFEATNAGQMALELVYHRPWEEGEEPLETFSLHVTVR